MKHYRSRWLFCFLILFCSSVTAQSRQTGAAVVMREALEEDVYAAGRVIQVLAPVTGDVVIAGELLSVSGTVEGDIIAAGRELTFSGAVSDDIRAAGENVSILERVGGHIVAAGRGVTLAEGSSVTDDAWLAGETIILRGNVDGAVRAAGRRIEILGTTGSDVIVYGSEVTVGDNARIAGSLTVHAEREPVVSESAEITGQVTYLPLEKRDGVFGGLFLLLTIAAAAIVVVLLSSQLVQRMTAAARSAPWINLGTGLAALIGTPLLVLALFITVLGSYLAFGLIALYALLIVFGFVAGLLVLSSWALALLGKRRPAPEGRLAQIGAIVVTTVILWLVTLIPVLGGIVLLLLLLAGIGALTVSGFRAWRSAMATAH